MEIATALIWTLRIVLPIILFWIYFKLQSPKDEYATGPTNNCYTRSKLLEHRKAVSISDPAPESLESLTLKGEAEAPALFAPTPGRQQRGGAGRKPGPGEPARRDRGERAERREPREPREAPREVPRAPKEAPNAEESSAPSPSESPPKAVTAEPPSAEEGEESDKMHLESLLNYVAFNRKEQQRTFLIDEDSGAPPPPPPPPKKKTTTAAPPSSSALTSPAAPASWSDKSVETITISTATSGKANAEAQMVLKGAMNFKRSDVAKELYNQLADSDVEIAEQTFTLMIEACILAKDLKHASDFLMKMEAKGYCPDMELLDKVMDLYSVQKVQREQEKQIAKAGGDAMHSMDGQWAPDGMMSGMQLPMAASVEGVLEEMRPKLSSAAAIYVPMSGVVGEEDGGSSSLRPAAEDEEPAAKTPLSMPGRSALSVRAKPFQPVQDVVFDPGSHTWTVNALGGQGEGGEHEKSSGKGKGGGKRGNKKADNEGKEKAKKSKERGDAKLEEKRQDAAPEKNTGKKERKEWKAKDAA